MPPFVAVPFAGAPRELADVRVTKGPVTEAHDVDLIGFELADPEDRFAPVRTSYDLRPRRGQRTDVPVGDLVGGMAHHRNGDGSFRPSGGIAAIRLG